MTHGILDNIDIMIIHKYYKKKKNQTMSKKCNFSSIKIKRILQAKNLFEKLHLKKKKRG
jgi:hypothetical protein